jgi:gentisate 1,2-dioxygenase
MSIEISHTHTVVVFHGSGRSVIDGVRFAWGPGDVFVTPSWASVDHEAAVQADLFAISDRTVLQVLHLYRAVRAIVAYVAWPPPSALPA